MPELNWNLDILLLYLSNATMRILPEARDRVFQDMANRLMEWEDISVDEMRAAFHSFGKVLIETCSDCGTVLEPGELCCIKRPRRPSDGTLPPLPPSPVVQYTHPDHSALKELLL